MLSMDTSVVPKVRLIGHIVYKEPWMHFTRTIDENIFYMVKSGELYIREGNDEYVLRKGDWLFLEPGITHAGFRESCCDYFYVHFKHPAIHRIENRTDNDIMDEMLLKRRLFLTDDFLLDTPPADSLSYLPKYYHLENDTIILLMLKEATDEFYKKYENYKQVVSCRMLELFIRLSRAYLSCELESSASHFPRGYIKARKLLNYLNREYHAKITSTLIEETFEVNYDYLNRVFHKLTGYTILNYLNMVRINKAKELIETTSIKFSEIGYLVGVEDPYYFSRLFKKYTGMTSTQYWEKKNILAQ